MLLVRHCNSLLRGLIRIDPRRGVKTAMPIPRLHLFELEDQPWFPAIIRDLATDYLHFVETRLALHRPVATLLSEALRTTKEEHIIDLCSGGGGPIPSLQQSLAEEGLHIHFTLTDRFPNVEAFERVAEHSQGAITFTK